MLIVRPFFPPDGRAANRAKDRAKRLALSLAWRVITASPNKPRRGEDGSREWPDRRVQHEESIGRSADPARSFAGPPGSSCVPPPHVEQAVPPTPGRHRRIFGLDELGAERPPRRTVSTSFCSIRRGPAGNVRERHCREPPSDRAAHRAPVL